MKVTKERYKTNILTRELNDINNITHIINTKKGLALEIVKVGVPGTRKKYLVDDIFNKIKNLKIIEGTRYKFWVLSPKRYDHILSQYRAIAILPCKFVGEEIEKIKNHFDE